MDKNELERRLEAAEKQNLGLLDEIKNLKAQLAEMQDEPEIPDFPVFKCYDVTYSLDSCLDIMQEEHGGGIGDSDYMGGDASYYNNFHSKDYADEFRRKCLLIAMMLHCKWYTERDALHTSEKTWLYTICYDKEKKKLVYVSYCSCEPCAVTFRTEEAAKKCADWLNKHWSGCDD